ncbi:TetR/AcrR family transcriptional regulator [Streptomyces sp. B1866]|uniref:TetR/AcrR family transcriptional regulator n=1 Tax=Streptomyces sp. B1866 TaxID=3075431 RepID=UPI00288EEDE4|nr:TetR/AcrR family transcriptional regulator [Streptomyces sp. B1866]MDT3396791.1 TetR/AcrR family transcriptional regulator [Streptomyces sp. B1866]
MLAHGPIIRTRRPRMTPEREAEVLAGVVEVLREVGYESLTMDAVAARARCGKATLYRQWQGKPQLVAAALHAHRPARAGEIDTGSLRGDFVTLVTRIAERTQRDTPLLMTIAHAGLNDRDLAVALRQSLIAPEAANLSRFVERAVERGELAHRPAAADFLPQMLFASITLRPLLEDEFIDADYLTRFVDGALLPALRHS